MKKLWVEIQISWMRIKSSQTRRIDKTKELGFLIIIGSPAASFLTWVVS